ncbi:MAG TPA: hypothetical protein VG320_23375 [Paraburkholderia sp.]|uniref:hypothetical protein n=1 Tax=Paraburkholderia sp. TaxID=1926495 RepID=UPI002DE71B58|nr:hypothetical protein [Paraburkholderia sp.]
MLHRHLIARLLTGLLPLLSATAAHASSDDSCYATATLRQPGYSCGGLPILSPGNDTRINAMLLMADSKRLSQAFPDPRKVPVADRPNQLVVPFLYDYSGWIDIGQKSGNANDDADANGQSASYADGEGSICRSVTTGDQEFNDALGAAKGLPADEAARLRAARVEMAKACAASTDGSGNGNGNSNGASAAAWHKPTGLKSPLGQQFATYLEGANAFYRYDFFAATKSFASASHSSDPWLREASLYMAGRAQLNAAQAGAFGFGGDATKLDRSNVRQVSLDAARTVFRAYLKVYPHGLYAASAEGLQRRVAWLGGDAQAQADSYSRAFATWTADDANVPIGQLANEFDNKLLMDNPDVANVQSPAVLAIVDLMRMRTQGSDDSSQSKTIKLDELQAQKPVFARMPALHDYLLASYHVYVDRKPDQALALLPDTPGASASPGSLGYFGLSQQALRAFALEDSGQADKARQLWSDLVPLAKLRLQREALELALAINLEQAGLVDRAFADDSPIQNAAIRATLLQRAANADLLRAQAQNKAVSGTLRDIALNTLLYKEFTRSRYADFLADLALVPATPADTLKPFTQPGAKNSDGYACPSARDIAATLQMNPTDGKGLNCLAEFVRSHPAAAGLGEDSALLDPAFPRPDAASGAAAPPPTLGSMPSQFQGAPYQRIASYQSVMNNTQASADDRAYALYRAINCFAPSGYSDCGGNKLPTSTRKRWFNTLKTAYPRSQWAQAQKYYW